MSLWSGFKSFASKFESVFVNIFKKAPTIEQTIQGVVAIAGPMLEGILLAVDPAAVPIVTPIISAIESRLATLHSVTTALGGITPGSTPAATAVNMLNGMKSDIGELLSLAEVKNSAKVTQITDITDQIVNDVDMLLGKLPTAA